MPGAFLSNRQKIAVVGSRHFSSKDVVARYIAALPTGTVVISGGAVGVDTWAIEAAQASGLATQVFQADWDNLGRRAGPIRNAEIVAAADEIVAFWDGKSRGTLNTVVQASRSGKPVKVFGPQANEIPLAEVVEIARQRGVIAAANING